MHSHNTVILTSPGWGHGTISSNISGASSGEGTVITPGESHGTSPTGTVGEAVKRSLEARGLTVRIFDGPDAHRDQAGFIRELRKMITATGPAIILPVFFPEVLAEHRDELPRECIIPLDTAEKIKTLDNKKSACELAAKLQIPQPRRYAATEEIKTYPVVFKRTTGQGGDSVYFPKDKRALENLTKTAKEYLITDFIEGENWCVDCLRKRDQKASATFRAAAYKVLEPQGKGVSTKRQPVEAPQLEQYCRQLLEAIDYTGVCEIDFRRSTKDGQFFFLECNPRFSGGIETTIEGGFDIAWEWIKDLER